VLNKVDGVEKNNYNFDNFHHYFKHNNVAEYEELKKYLEYLLSNNIDELKKEAKETYLVNSSNSINKKIPELIRSKFDNLLNKMPEPIY